MQAELLQARAHESDAHIARLAQERDAGSFTSTKVQILAHLLAQKYKYGRTLRASHKSETPVLAQKYKCWRIYKDKSTNTDARLTQERDAGSQRLAQTAY